MIGRQFIPAFNGHHRSGDRRSRIMGGSRGESAREIVSRRDRNYPSQSLVGNISAEWHAKTRHWRAVRWTDGRTDGRCLSRAYISYAPFFLRASCDAVARCRRWSSRCGPSAIGGSSTRGYLFASARDLIALLAIDWLLLGNENAIPIETCVSTCIINRVNIFGIGSDIMRNRWDVFNTRIN